MSFSGVFSQTFNKSKDLILADFDLLPDEDDAHAVATLGFILKHPDFDGVNYHVVAGAYGTQRGFTLINTAVPEIRILN